MTEHLVATGQLLAVHRGVYRDPAAPVTDDQRRLAAVLAGGSTAVLGHRTATAHWGLPNFRCDLLEVTKPSKATSLAPGILAHRTRRLPDAERTIHRGVPITTPARTLIDLASVVTDGIVRMAMERCLSCGRMSLRSLEVTIERDWARPGQDVVAKLLVTRILGGVQADSPAEATLGELLLRAGVTGLVHHHLVTVTSGRTFELDWSFPEEMIALELDGYGVHLRSLDAFEGDRDRRNELEIDGWAVMNFTRRQVERRPHSVLDQVTRMRASRTQGASTLLQIL